MNLQQYGAGVFTIDNYLSPQECANYIRWANSIGFEEAKIQSDQGEIVFKQIRNNDRVIVDDPIKASQLYQLAKNQLPEEIDGWQIVGLNERLRFYRYANDQYFHWHKDGAFVRSEIEESMLTFMVYLNEGYGGGETEFRWDKIEPRQGMALVFPHRLQHQGNRVTTGEKLVLRTDVMYRAL